MVSSARPRLSPSRRTMSGGKASSRTLASPGTSCSATLTRRGLGAVAAVANEHRLAQWLERGAVHTARRGPVRHAVRRAIEHEKQIARVQLQRRGQGGGADPRRAPRHEHELDLTAVRDAMAPRRAHVEPRVDGAVEAKRTEDLAENVHGLQSRR